MVAVGNLLSAVAPSYSTLMLARFVPGLPHRACSGIVSVVAASLVPANRRAWAVSMMLVGLTVSNVVGVPLTTLMGQQLGWRSPYLLVTAIGIATMAAIWAWVAPQGVGASMSVRGELSALRRPQVWMALLVGMVGFGGMFATCTYITSTMTTLAGFSPSAVTLVLAVYGLGLTGGMLLGGRLADRAVMATLAGGLVAVTLILATFGVLAQSKTGAVIGVFLLGVSIALDRRRPTA